MSLFIKVDNPDLEDEAEVVIDRLGAFPNGGSYEITDEELEAYQFARGVSLEDAMAIRSDVETSETSFAAAQKVAKKKTEKPLTTDGPEGSDS